MKLGNRKKPVREAASVRVQEDAVDLIQAKTGGDALKIVESILKRVKLPSGNIGTLRGEFALTEEVRGIIHTGSLGLDLALGVGGLPRGRIVELFGMESSGKTTLALHCIAQVQKAGGVAAFIDAEHALDVTYAAALGVNLEQMIFYQPDSGEGALNTVDELVDTGDVDLIVIDSVAALTPLAELEGEIGQQLPGSQARMMSQALRKYCGKMHKTDTTIIFINQIRMKIGVVYGSPKTTSGGEALKFYSSVRVEVSKIGGLKQNDEQFGNRVKFNVIKNKVAPPFRHAEVDIIYGQGVSYLGELIDFAVAKDIIQKSGAWFSYGENRLGQGRDNSMTKLEENPEWVKEITAKVFEAYGIKS